MLKNNFGTYIITAHLINNLFAHLQSFIFCEFSVSMMFNFSDWLFCNLNMFPKLLPMYISMNNKMQYWRYAMSFKIFQSHLSKKESYLVPAHTQLCNSCRTFFGSWVKGHCLHHFLYKSSWHQMMCDMFKTI